MTDTALRVLVLCLAVILKYMTVAPVCSLNLPRLDMILFLDLLRFRIFDNYSIKWDWVWCIEENVIHRGRGGGGRGFCPGLWEYEMRGNLVINAMLPRPDVSLSMKCPRKGRREGDNGRGSASPTVCTLPMVPCGSSPVTCVLCSPLRCEKRSAWGGGWTQWVKSG